MALFDFLKKKDAPEKGPTLGPPPGPPATSPGTAPPTDKVIQMQQQGMTNDQIIVALQREGYAQAQIYDALNQAAAKKSVETIQPRKVETREEDKKKMAEKIEELAESIIEEKWKKAATQFGKLKEWQDETHTRIVSLEQEMKNTRADLDNLHKAIIGKINDYDKNLLDVGTEIKAMERVFQKILPEMTKNVRDLSEISKSFKKKG